MSQLTLFEVEFVHVPPPEFTWETQLWDLPICASCWLRLTHAGCETLGDAMDLPGIRRQGLVQTDCLEVINAAAVAILNRGGAA